MSTVYEQACRHIDGLSELRVHDHPCTLYNSTQELKRQFVPYMQAGLALGERCVYFVHDLPPEFILEAMREGGFELAPFLERGAFEVVHACDAHLCGDEFNEQAMSAYWADAVKDARQSGFKAMRAAVEMAWIAQSGATGCDVLAAYESRLNDFVCTQRLSIMCQYDRRRFAADKLKAVVHAHATVVANDEVFANPSVVHPDHFTEADPDMDLQFMLDNLALIKRLEDTTKALERAYDELQHLAYVMSHELQEPVATIRSYQNLLSARYRGRLGSDADSFIEQCTRSADTVARMIDDLWTYARIHKPGEEFAEVDMNRAAQTAVGALASLIEERDASVDCETLLPVLGLESQLHDVLRRLIENAVRYCDAERPRVRVRSHKAGDTVEFVIEDNGAGIDKVHIKDAFKLFNRLGRRPGHDGTGMGLPICRRIVEHHRGKIWMESSQSGTKVSFSACPVD